MSITRPEHQRGFSIVAAIFILVVLAALGAFLVSVSSTQHLALALDAMSSRVQQAARGGLEWGVYQALKASPAPAFRSACEAAAAGAASAAPTTSLDLAAGDLPGLAEFRVDLEFAWYRVQEGGSAYCIYEITATACNAASCPAAAPGLGYVEHQQVARVTQ